MQRKSNILKSHRSAMAMIMAIIAIVIISTILAISISLSAQTSKNSVDLYVYEQANLLARSAGEYARLQIGKNNPCDDTNVSISFIENNHYNITIAVKYVYDTSIATCSTALTHAATSQDAHFGAALIDITVTVNDTTVTSEPIRVFRRKLVEL